MLTIHVVTLFPEAIAPYLASSIPGRAEESIMGESARGCPGTGPHRRT